MLVKWHYLLNFNEGLVSSVVFTFSIDQETYAFQNKNEHIRLYHMRFAIGTPRSAELSDRKHLYLADFSFCIHTLYAILLKMVYF